MIIKKRIVFCVLTLVVLCSTAVSFGQKLPNNKTGKPTTENAAKIEQELMRHIKNIKELSAYANSGYDEKRDQKLEKENATFQAKLLKFTKLPATLKYRFPELNKYLTISTSRDGKFRIYSWDTEDGGTMHFFRNIYQYQGVGGKVFSQTDKLDAADPGGFASDIFTLKTGKAKVYLARVSSILSNPLAYQSINLFRVEGNKLNDKVKLIKTASRITHTLGFQYNFFSVVDRKERPIKLIVYDEAARAIKIPIVIEDKKDPIGRVTNKFITYKFNGTYFVKVS